MGKTQKAHPKGQVAPAQEQFLQGERGEQRGIDWGHGQFVRVAFLFFAAGEHARERYHGQKRAIDWCQAHDLEARVQYARAQFFVAVAAYVVQRAVVG